MRWKLPLPYQRRVVKKFALRPKILGDNYRVWLEKYYVEEQYGSRTGSNQHVWHVLHTWSHATEKKNLLEKLK